jgi:hypothetical protein
MYTGGVRWREAQAAGGVQGGDEAVHPGGDQLHGPHQDEGDSRGLPGGHRHQCRGHRTRLLQRLPAAGYQGGLAVSLMTSYIS